MQILLKIKIGVAMLTSGEKDLTSKSIFNDKKGHFIMIKKSQFIKKM